MVTIFFFEHTHEIRRVFPNVNVSSANFCMTIQYLFCMFLIEIT